MKTPLLCLLVLLAACHQSDANNEPSKNATTIVSSDTIPETRNKANPGPAAEYTEPIKDELNNWKFAVSIYETNRTFHYTVRIQCKEVRVSDSLSIPNFGIQPKIEIHKGKEPLSCIIGFLDKKNEFKEYRLVSFKNDQLHVKTLNSYSVNAYRTSTK